MHPLLRCSSDFPPSDILLDLSQRSCGQAKSVSREDVGDAGTKDLCSFLSFLFSLASAVVHRRHSEPKPLAVPIVRGHCCLKPPAGCLMRIQCQGATPVIVSLAQMSWFHLQKNRK